MNSVKMRIKSALKEADYLYDTYMKSGNVEDYSIPLFQAARACELILSEILNLNGVLVENGTIKNGGHGSKSMPVLSFCAINTVSFIPKECKSLINEIRKFRNMAVHTITTSQSALFEFTKAYKSFVAWAYESYPEMLGEKDEAAEWIAKYVVESIDDLDIKKQRDRMSSYLNYLDVYNPRDKIEQDNIKDEPNVQYRISPADTSIVAEPKVYYGRKQEDDISNAELLKTILSAMEEHTNRAISLGKDNTERIIEEIDTVAELLKKLLTQINEYQYLVQSQIDLALSEDEIDRIVEGYANTCVEKIVENVGRKNSESTYSLEEDKLKNSMGDAWNKLSEESKVFLVSSKVTYNYLLSIPSAIDYSGVCLLVTKALEVELSKRFFSMYMEYLERAYGNVGKSKKQKDYSKYPPIMFNKYGAPMRAKDFTLGRVPYTLCACFDENITEEEKESNIKNLIAYAKEELFIDKKDEEIRAILISYGEKVGEITREYRNKAAHTNQLKRVDADQCFDIVLDVEKFLKKMLDSFKK